jgi:hypothetical protein
LFHCFSDREANRVGFPNVGGKREGGVAARSNVFRHGGSPATVEIQSEHMSALLPEQLSGRLADPGRCSSDDGYLAL